MESPPRKLPPKKDVLDAFLGNGSARIFIDPRRSGVLVPKWFAKQPELVLRVGYSLSPPIPDLVVSDEAVSCTLSFNRSPHWCKMPWNAVFAVVSDVDGRGVVWPDDVPVESQLLKPARPKPKLASVGKEKDDAKPELRSVGRPREDASPDSSGKVEVTPVSSRKDPNVTLMSATDLPADADASGEAPIEPGSGKAEAPKSAPPSTDADATTRDATPPETEGEDPDPSQGKKPKRQLPPYLRVVK